MRATSMPSAEAIWLGWRSSILAARIPPAAAPTRKAPSETSGATTGSPPLPAIPKPRNTMLPVMFAVNTRPSPRKLTASTSPVVNVRTRSARASGCRRLRAARLSKGPGSTPDEADADSFTSYLVGHVQVGRLGAAQVVGVARHARPVRAARQHANALLERRPGAAVILQGGAPDRLVGTVRE